MSWFPRSLVLLSLLPLAFPAAAAPAEGPEFGARFNAVAAGGEPANDILSAGLFGRFRLNERWLLGVALDRAGFDFERPWKPMGLQQDPAVEVIDASAEMTTLSVWAERELAPGGGRLRWFWTGGLGFASPDVDDVTGPLAGGGTFDITTDPGSEILLSASAGLRLPFAKRWGFDFQLRADHHLADWEVTDRTSGRRATLNDYTAFGTTLALSCRF